MAKHDARAGGGKKTPRTDDQPMREYSLEDILTEYRESVAPPEPEEETFAPAEPIPMEEEQGILTAQVPEREPDPVPELPEEEEPQAQPPVDDGGGVMDEVYDPQELRGAEEESAPAPSPEELREEGFEDDDDFYAGALPGTEPPEIDASETDTPDAGEEPPERDARQRRRSPVQRKSGGNGFAKAWGKLTELLAVASFRRQQIRRQAPPEPENADKEMPPEKAARFYLGQMPALKLRSFGALGVCVLLIWITVGSNFGVGLPGRLAGDVRLAAMVALVGQITVLLFGLDVITAGVMSLVRGRPGAESMLFIASLASALDAIAIIITKNGSRGLPYAAITSLGVFFALRGGWHTARGFHDTFLALYQTQEPISLVQETLEESATPVLVTRRQDTAGFIRRSEEPSEAESLAGEAFLPLMIGSLALSLAVAVGGGDMGAFFHLFALMTALCANFGWLFSIPALFSRVSRHLMVRGSALAGWSGARDAGRGRRLVISDTDIFPEDTVEITGISLLAGANAQDIVAVTGTMISIAGAGTAGVFKELMHRYKSAMQTVEDFSIGEGGCKGRIRFQEVRVGTLGYMHLSGVKIPEKLRQPNTIYTALDGRLAGVFCFRYRAMGSVQRALYTLRKKHRQPLFAVRDFNLDPMLLRRSFGVSTEGFVFPPVVDRYRISEELSEGKGQPVGIMAQNGLDLIVDLSECGTQLYRLGRLCAWVCVVCAVLGMVLTVPACWTGSWAGAAAWRILVYLLLWLLPTLASWLITEK